MVGVPDKKYGEQLPGGEHSRIQRFAHKGRLIEYCNGRIARHKIPKHWEFTSTVPMTASGKVQKYKIVEQYSSDTPPDRTRPGAGRPPAPAFLSPEAPTAGTHLHSRSRVQALTEAPRFSTFMPVFGADESRGMSP